jgi:hypothetical protein
MPAALANPSGWGFGLHVFVCVGSIEWNLDSFRLNWIYIALTPTIALRWHHFCCGPNKSCLAIQKLRIPI